MRYESMKWAVLCGHVRTQQSQTRPEIYQRKQKNEYLADFAFVILTC